MGCFLLGDSYVKPPSTCLRLLSVDGEDPHSGALLLSLLAVALLSLLVGSTTPRLTIRVSARSFWQADGRKMTFKRLLLDECQSLCCMQADCDETGCYDHMDEQMTVFRARSPQSMRSFVDCFASQRSRIEKQTHIWQHTQVVLRT